MRWLIERSMFFANDQMHFVDALRSQHRKFALVEFVPFVHEIVPEPAPRCEHCDDPREAHDDDGGCGNSVTFYEAEALVAVGSTNFIRSVLGRKLKPGAWYNGDFRFEAWRDRLGSQLLNFDGEVQPFGALVLKGPRFVRPCEDLKAFSGALVDPADLPRFLEQCRRYDVMSEEHVLTDETPCVVAYPKEIDVEFRLFVVRRQVVSGCAYRPEWDAKHARLAAAKEFGQHVADQWGPADAYVMDVAKTPAGWFVLEYNCLNSAGLYVAPVEPIISSVEAMLASAPSPT